MAPKRAWESMDDDYSNQPQPKQPNGPTGYGSSQGQYPPGVQCAKCSTISADLDTAKQQRHTKHDEPLSKRCGCTMCGRYGLMPTTKTPPIAQNVARNIEVSHVVTRQRDFGIAGRGRVDSATAFATPMLAHSGQKLPISPFNLPSQTFVFGQTSHYPTQLVPGTNHANIPSTLNVAAAHGQRVLSPAGRGGDVAENRLPTFMSKIKQRLEHRKVSLPVVKDAQGRTVVLNFCEPRRCAFVPNTIAADEPDWKIIMYFREAAEHGVKLEFKDIVSRIHSGWIPDKKTLATRINALSTRIQRYTTALGQLAVFPKTFEKLPSKQAINTIASLTLLQCEFNTWWKLLS